MAILGELELAIMGTLWASDEALRVREVQELLQRDRGLAYTTVMTVLDRLAKKGLAGRVQEEGGRAWMYSAATSRAELVAGELAEVLADAGPDRAEALELFVTGLERELRMVLSEA